MKSLDHIVKGFTIVMILLVSCSSCFVRTVLLSFNYCCVFRYSLATKCYSPLSQYARMCDVVIRSLLVEMNSCLFVVVDNKN